MAALTAIALAGLAVGAAGVGVQAYGAMKANKAQQQQIALEQQMEAKRQQQLNLDAMRRKREIIRQGIAARGAALSTATAQGASYGTGLQGAYGNISGRENVNTLGVSQNQEIGNSMFGLNNQMLTAKSAQADAMTMASIGGGLGTLGGAIMRNAGSINNIGSAAFSFLRGV
jgi:hypothetical protein